MSDTWLPLEDRLALWDPIGEQVRVIGWRPGPAGVSSVDLAPGLRASVDHADPTTLTEVTIDADGGRIPDGTLTVLSSLLGVEASEAVRRLPTLGLQARPTPIRSRRRSVDDLPATDLWLPHLVLTADLAEDAARSDLGRAAALLDGVPAAAALGLALAHELAARGVELLLAAPFTSLRPDVHAALHDRLDAVERRTPAAVADLDLHRARRRLDDAGAQQRPAARRARFRPTSAPPAAAAGAPVAAAKAAAPMEVAYAAIEADAAAADDLVADRGAPLLVDGDHRSWAWLERGGNVHLQASTSATGAWGRVYRAADRLLLGLAPLRERPDADGLRALVVVPPTGDPDALVVDVVDDPTEPRRAPAHDQLRRAIQTGRRAAQLSRRGDPEADAAWQECAHHWRGLGDTQRANLAARHGRRDDRSPRARRFATLPPLLADDLDVGAT